MTMCIFKKWTRFSVGVKDSSS